MEIQWLRDCTSTAVNMCSIPRQGTKSPNAVQLCQKIEINKVKYKIKMGDKDLIDISSKYFRHDYILIRSISPGAKPSKTNTTFHI